MNLSGQEKIDIAKAVFSALPSQPALGNFLLRINVNLEWIKSSKPDTVALYEYVVQYLDATGDLIDFLRFAREKYRDNQLIQNAFNSLVDKTGSHDGAYENACLINGRYPFVNRRKLRRYVQELYNGGGACILSVNGPTKSGRSFSKLFVAHFCKPQGITLVPILLKDYLNRTASDLVKQIALRLAWDIKAIPEQHAQETQWVEELGKWLAGRFDMDERTIWLIFDDCSTIGLPQSIRELLTQLTKEVPYIKKTRLIFLAHEEPIIGEPSLSTVYEEIDKPTKNDLKIFFENCIAFHNLDMEDSLEQLVDEVWKQLSPDSINFVENLSKTLKIAMEAFLND